MRPLNIPSASQHHSATPVRAHQPLYGAPPPVGYPYSHYAMPPHSHHMPPPPPGYALVPVGEHQPAGNPVSPDAQGNLYSKHHQFDNHMHSHHGTSSSASINRTPPRNIANGVNPSRQTKQGSPLPFNPSTGTPSQRVSHPSPLRPPCAPGKLTRKLSRSSIISSYALMLTIYLSQIRTRFSLKKLYSWVCPLLLLSVPVLRHCLHRSPVLNLPTLTNVLLAPALLIASHPHQLQVLVVVVVAALSLHASCQQIAGLTRHLEF
jgi:hypothetical protein